MVRALIIVLLTATPLVAQGGITWGLHGCMAWSDNDTGSDVGSDDREVFYGGGVDITYKPPMSPIGVEGGFTYLVHEDEEDAFDVSYGAHPIYVNGKFFLNPMIYVCGGVNYTLWKFEINDEGVDDLSSEIGFQFGGGVELGTGSTRLFGSLMYMIQKGKWEPSGGFGEAELEFKSFQVRAGLRFGG